VDSDPPLFPLPRLADPRILRVVAGLRPYRDGGIRLEAEPRGDRWLIHHYGHGGAGFTLAFGSAEEAAALVAARAAPPERVAVLGAGVVGLATAFVLLERGYRVRVLAREFPPRTQSDAAGAEWFPVGVEPGRTPPERDRFRRMLEAARRRLETFARDPSWFVTPRALYEEPEDPHTGSPGAPAGSCGTELRAAPAFAPIPLLPPDLLPPATRLARLPFPGPARPGLLRASFLIEPPRFLPRLLGAVLEGGAVLAHRGFAHESELRELDERVVVACTGLGGRELFGDRELRPVRGQLVHLAPEPLEYLLTHRQGYVVPRSDTVVLGGTWEPGCTDLLPDHALTEAILDRHRRWAGVAPAPQAL
jgi:D-amino-acid oxidase